MTTLSTPDCVSQAARRGRSGVKVATARTAGVARCGGTATKCAGAPLSMAAACRLSGGRWGGGQRREAYRRDDGTLGDLLGGNDERGQARAGRSRAIF